MFNVNYMNNFTEHDYYNDQFCLHIIHIHAAGKIKQFVDRLSMKSLESMEKCLPEWPKLRGSDRATWLTLEFLNATLYGEAVDAFRQAIPEAKSRNAMKIDRLTHDVTDMNTESLERLKHALSSLNDGKPDYDCHEDSKVGLNAFLHGLIPNETKTLEKILNAQTVEQIKHFLQDTPIRYRFQFHRILEDVTDERIRKNVDAPTAESLIKIRQRIGAIVAANNFVVGEYVQYELAQTGIAEYCAKNDWNVIPQEGLAAINKALNAPTVENLEAMKQMLGNPAAEKLDELEGFMNRFYE